MQLLLIFEAIMCHEIIINLLPVLLMKLQVDAFIKKT